MELISCDAHAIRKALMLSLSEMAVLRNIYKLSTNPKYGYKCIQSKKNMADWLDLGEDTIYRHLNTLEAKGYIVRGSNWCKPTQFIYDIATSDQIEMYIKGGDTQLLSINLLKELSQGQTSLDDESLKIVDNVSENRSLSLRKSETKYISKISKQKNKENFSPFEQKFDEVRRMFPGETRGLQTEFKNFQKHKDWKEELDKLKSALEREIKSKEVKKQRNQFVPEWTMFQTWINQRRWEIVHEVEQTDDERYKELETRGWKNCSVEELTFAYNYQRSGKINILTDDMLHYKEQPITNREYYATRG